MDEKIKKIPASVRTPVLLKFLQGIRSSGRKIKKIYLFGSRARGTEKPYSDYDLLLLVSDSFTLADKDKLYDTVAEILGTSGDVVSLKIFKRKKFDELRRMKTPFMQHIMREGVRIG